MAPREGVRPTSDRVRERLFAVLGDPGGGTVVDLFCGAGTLGIEALSRGAERLYCVDRDAATLRVLAANLTPMREAGVDVTVIRRDALGFVREAWPAGPVEWVFLDPPYGDPAGADCLAALAQLRAGKIARVIFEGPGGAIAAPPGLSPERELDFGDTRITLLRGGLRP